MGSCVAFIVVGVGLGMVMGHCWGGPVSLVVLLNPCFVKTSEQD
jgi:hypothetical protein